MMFALVGVEYGATLAYSFPALICGIQFFRPTLIGWYLIFLTVLTGCVIYGFMMVQDFLRKMGGSEANILVDGDDSIVFSLLVAVLIGLVAWLWLVRPGKRDSSPKSTK
jgi:hypothetical protein